MEGKRLEQPETISDELWKIIGWDDKIQDTSSKEENKENEEKKVK